MAVVLDILISMTIGSILLMSITNAGHVINENSQLMNDQDRLLHRQVNNGAVGAIGAVSRFTLKYYSQGMMDTLTTPVGASDLEMIKVVEITMEVQNPAALYRDKRDVKAGERDAMFSSSLWRQTRLASQNLKR